MLRSVVALGVVVMTGSCIDVGKVGDFALCCTCLAQKSPQNGGDGANAVDATQNCLPDEDAEDPEALSEVDLCNEQASDVITDPDNAPGIDVVDENCAIATCLDECRGAGLDQASFNVVEEGLSD